MAWRNRDWFWLVGILIGIMILLIAGFYNKENVKLNFSIISSAVSIALALVAIFIALSQSRDNKELSTNMNVTMAVMNEKLSSVNEKVNRIDPDVLVKVYRQKIDDVITEVGNSIKSGREISPEEIEEKYRKEFDLAEMELEDILNDMNRNNKDRSLNISYKIGDKVRHKKWGTGEVIKVKGKDDATEISVLFPEPVGLKQLLAKYAPVTKIE